MSSGNSGNSGDVPTCTGGANSTGIDSTYSTGEDGQHPMSLLHPNSHALAHSILNDSSAQAVHRHLHQHHMTNEGETSYRFHRSSCRASLTFTSSSLLIYSLRYYLTDFRFFFIVVLISAP